MTLGDFFRMTTENPSILVFYFIAVPLTALLALIFSRGEGHISPWKFLYSSLVYLTCLPGIFAITLSAYLFLFERRSIMDTNIYTQIIPVISMIITLWLIRKNVSLDLVPGFGRLSGLLLILFTGMAMLWVLDKTRIFVITFVPFVWVMIFILVMVVLAIVGFRRLST